MCREAQRKHIHESVSNNSSAKIWEFLETLGIGQHCKTIHVNDRMDLDQLI